MNGRDELEQQVQRILLVCGERELRLIYAFALHLVKAVEA